LRKGKNHVFFAVAVFGLLRAKNRNRRLRRVCGACNSKSA
jgi:hypothetical protein